MKKLIPVIIGLSVACHGGNPEAHAGAGGFSGPDTGSNGNGASCERGNASFCGRSGGSNPSDGGNPPGLSRNDNTNNNINNAVSSSQANQRQRQNQNQNVTVNSSGGRGGSGGTGGIANASANANGGKGGQGGQGGRGGSGGSATGGRGGAGGNATANGGTATANGGSAVGRGGKGGKAYNKGNRQTVKVKNTGNNYYRGDTPVAPMAMPGAPAKVGDVTAPLPAFVVGGFLTSVDDPWGSGSGDSVDAGVTVGINIPLGAGEFKDAALLRAKFQLAKEAKWLEDNGLLDQDKFPEHYAMLHGGMEETSEE